MSKYFSLFWLSNFVTNNLLILFLLINSAFSNLLYALNIGAENSFFYIPVFTFLLFYFYRYKKLYFINLTQKYFFLSILIISIINLSYFIIFNFDIIFYINKIGFFIKLFIFIGALYIIHNFSRKDIDFVLLRFLQIIIFVTLFTYIFYLLNLNETIHLKDRLITYIDSQPFGILHRFGALSFELIDYNLVMFYTFIILIHKNLNIYVKSLIGAIFIYLIYISYSNISILFFTIYVLSYILISLNAIRLIPTVTAIGIIIYFIFFNRETIEFLLQHFHYIIPRNDGTLTLNTAVGARLLPNLYSLEYIKDNFFTFPPGGLTGMLVAGQHLPILKSHIPSGITQIFLDWTFLSIPLIIFLLYKYQCIIKSIEILQDFRIIYIINISIVYVMFQASYLNFTMWIMIFLLNHKINLLKKGPHN